MDIYAALGDDWREYAYSKASEIIKKLNFDIYTPDDLERIDRIAIKGLGKKMMNKLKEIVETGTLQKLTNFGKDDKVQTLLMFSRIWGAGAQTALKWYNLGYRSLQDLQNSNEISFQQEIGIRYYEELLVRISRSEVKDIEDMARKAFEIAIRERNRESLPSSLQVVTCGSYRRGAETCGDVDLVITDGSDDPRVSEGLLVRVIQILEKDGFLTDHLSLPSRVSQLHDDGEQTWSETYMGICQRSKVSCVFI
jgi:DNA polymerase lambda